MTTQKYKFPISHARERGHHSMKNSEAPGVANAHEEGKMQGVAAVTGGFGDWQAECDALIADTRKHVVLPSDACVMLSLAAQVLLARRALRRLDEIRATLDDYEREHLTPRNLAFEGMLLPRIAQLARGQTSSPNTKVTHDPLGGRCV